MSPTVVIATPSALLAQTYRTGFSGECKALGLTLLVNPWLEVADSTHSLKRDDDDPEGLFEWLGSLNVEAQAHTQVWLDLTSYGRYARDAFRPKSGKVVLVSPTSPHPWYCREGRPGPAWNLLMRHPLVYPVFIVEQWAPEAVAEDLERFLPNKTDLPKTEEFKQPPSRIEWVTGALQHPIHFRSIFDEPSIGGERTANFLKQLTWFADGLRTYFDPTGLRTSVRRYMLGGMFGSHADWSQSVELTELQAQRLNRECIAVDDEREYSLLNAYLGWRSGHRAWPISTFKGLLSWPEQACVDREVQRLLIRDLEFRFPDLERGAQDGPATSRTDLECFDRWPPSVRDRLLRCTGKLPQLIVSVGRRESEELASTRHVSKPLGHMHQLLKEICSSTGLDIERGSTTFIAQLTGPQRRTNSIGHSIEYLNAEIADQLLAQSQSSSSTFEGDILRALLAQEAYENLGGMSPIKGGHALELLHCAEVRAESRFGGASYDIDTQPRAEELEATLDRLLNAAVGTGTGKQTRDKRAFLARLWGELKGIYKAGELFDAADQATKQCLSNQWSRPGWGTLVSFFVLLAPLALVTVTLGDLVLVDFASFKDFVFWPLTLCYLALLVPTRRAWNGWVHALVARTTPVVLDVSGWIAAAMCATFLFGGIGTMTFFTSDREVWNRSLNSVLKTDGSLDGPSRAVYPRIDVCASRPARTHLFEVADEMRDANPAWPKLQVYFRTTQQLVMSALQSNPATGYVPLAACLEYKGPPEVRLLLLTSIAFIATVVAIGILVSIIFRKVTRS